MITSLLQLACTYMVAYGLLLILIHVRTRFDRSFVTFGFMLISLSAFAAVDVWFIQSRSTPDTLVWYRAQHVVVCVCAVLLLRYVQLITHRISWQLLIAAMVVFSVLAALFTTPALLLVVDGRVQSTAWYDYGFGTLALMIGIMNGRALVLAFRSSSGMDRRIIGFHLVGLVSLLVFGVADLVVMISNASGSVYNLPSFTILGILAYGIVSSLVFTDRLLYLIHERDEFKELSILDPLTGLCNRRHIVAELDRRLASMDRHAPGGTTHPPSMLGVMMIDVDHFKSVNDSLGHSAGDHVLKEVALRMLAVVREDDVCGRYGCEEYMIVVGRVDGSTLMTIAERLRQTVEDLGLILDGKSVRVTVSIGCALAPQHTAERQKLIACADQALYQSKSNGRNRCTMFGAEPNAAIHDSQT